MTPHGDEADEPDDGLRVLVSRLDEVNTAEKVVASGEVGWFCAPGLVEVVARRSEGAGGLDDTLVDKGARPRRDGGCCEVEPHTVGCARAALEAEEFSEPGAEGG